MGNRSICDFFPAGRDHAPCASLLYETEVANLMPIPDSLMTEIEVAKYLNVSVASIRRWRLLQRGPQLLKVGPGAIST